MKIFLSYSSVQRAIAERVDEVLESEGHDVFFDRDALPVGETYDRRIREAVRECRLFVFLLSPESIEPGCYALTELGYVEALEAAQRPALLPVLVALVDFARLPPFLGARTIYRPSGNLPAEVAAQVDLIVRQLERPLPQLIATPSNQGWLAYVDLGGEPAKEIFYRLREDDAWIGTGFSPARSLATGKPMPRADIALGPRRAPDAVFLKYVDINGREHGPYRIPFDPLQHFLRNCRDALRASQWVSFREWPAGHLLVYFSDLLSWKDALSAVCFSIDDKSLSRRLKFRGDPTRMGFEIDEHDELYVEAPAATAFVCVQVYFVDGTASEVRTFSVADLGVDR